MSQEIYDVVVLGGGAGGVPAAIRAWAAIEKVTKRKMGSLSSFPPKRALNRWLSADL